MCNGVEVKDPNRWPVSANCSVVSEACELGQARNETFTKIEQVCPRSIIDTVCPTKVDHTKSCSNESTPQFCRLKTIECGLSTYEASAYNGSLLFCQNVRSIECNGDVTELNRGGVLNTKFCRVAELNCNGTTQTFITDIPPSCSITKVPFYKLHASILLVSYNCCFIFRLFVSMWQT